MQGGSESDKVKEQTQQSGLSSNSCLNTLILWTLEEILDTSLAAIINIWTGFSKLLSLFGAYLMDTNQGIYNNSRMLLYSTIVYSLGLGFLYMSTPPVLDNMAGNCGEDRPECYGPAQKATFYISLVLTGVGMAGHAVSLDPFMDEHGMNEDGFWNPKSLVSKLMRAVINGVSSWLLPQHWSARFGVVAIYGFVATIALAIANANGDRIYTDKKKTKSEEDKKKDFCCNADHDEKKPKSEEDKKIDFCKMFNETAMVWPSFIMSGVVSSIGNTFFVEQADRMKPTAGVYTLPLGVLLLLAKTAKFILEHCYDFIYTLIKKFFNLCCMIKKNCSDSEGFDDADEVSALFGIGMAMLNAVLCCLAAAVVENARRQDSMKKYYTKFWLHHDSKFWLVPQFVFLIGIDAFLKKSINDFFENIAPLYKSSSEKKKEDQSIKNYLIQFTNFVIGLGFIGSVVSVLAVAKISKSVTGKSWIQKEVSDSRLENYYWVLAVLSSINIIYYVIAAICYTRKLKNKAPKNKTATGDPAQQPGDKTGCCSC